LVGFLAGRRQLALARFAAIEVMLNFGEVELESRRTAFDNDADPSAVRFAEGCDPKQFAKRAAQNSKLLARACRLLPRRAKEYRA
jgi:hypothetical protein